MSIDQSCDAGREDRQEDQGVTASPPLCRPPGGAADASPAKPAAANAVVCAEKHEARLSALAALERGWNGYRAEPISSYCIERARPLINLAEDLGLRPWITPLPDRGLSLERAGEDDWSLEINPDGSFDFHVRISCTWRARPNAAETAELFLGFAAAHIRSALNASAAGARSAETGTGSGPQDRQSGDAKQRDAQPQPQSGSPS